MVTYITCSVLIGALLGWCLSYIAVHGKEKGVIKLIEINESWAVDTDGDKNVILMKKVEKRMRDKKKKTWINTGEYDWSIYGYYPNLESLLKAVSRKEITGKGLKDIESIQEKIEDLEKVIKKTIKQYYK